MSIHNQSKCHIIDSTNYSRYVAGHLEHSAHITIKTSAATSYPILLSSYNYPRSIDGNLLPATNDHVLTFVNSGSIDGRYRYNSDTWKAADLKRNEWSITQAYENSIQWQWEANCKTAEPIICTKIHIPNELLLFVAENVFGLDPNHLELTHKLNVYDVEMQKALMALSQAIHNGARNDIALDTIYLETMAHLLSVHIVRYYCNYKQLSCGYRELPLRKLRDVIDYICTHFNQPLSLHTLASIASMSPYHFAHCFKRYLGQAPHQYLTRYRIEQAKTLLKTSSFTIDRVATEVGYESRNHFSLLFKRATGLSPRQFRLKS